MRKATEFEQLIDKARNLKDRGEFNPSVVLELESLYYEAFAIVNEKYIFAKQIYDEHIKKQKESKEAKWQ